MILAAGWPRGRKQRLELKKRHLPAGVMPVHCAACLSMRSTWLPEMPCAGCPQELELCCDALKISLACLKDSANLAIFLNLLLFLSLLPKIGLRMLRLSQAKSTPTSRVVFHMDVCIYRERYTYICIYIYIYPGGDLY